MGMYTELMLGVSFKSDTPENIIEILKGMCNYEEGDEILYKMEFDSLLPDHPLFSTSRWTWMLRSGSYYFDALNVCELVYDDISASYYLTVITNLKNYTGEIEEFIDWITPYVDTQGFAGYKRYEESEHPTLIYFNREV